MSNSRMDPAHADPTTRVARTEDARSRGGTSTVISAAMCARGVHRPRSAVDKKGTGPTSSVSPVHTIKRNASRTSKRSSEH
jgi:hypothetical protein